MRRLTPLLACAILAAAPTGVWAQESYTIKIKKSAKGIVERIQTAETNIEKTKVSDNQGNVVQDKSTTIVQIMTVLQATLERPDFDKMATALKNTCEKVQITVDGVAEKVPYEGKTVLIEKKGDKYAFRYEGDGAITGNDAKWLDKDFNDKDDDGSTLDRIMFPMKAVKVGETWKIPMDEIVKAFAKRHLILDVDKCTATGKLLKVFMKDGRQYGEMSFALDLPVKLIKSDTGDVRVKEGGIFKLEASGTGCIDGSVTDSQTKMSLRFIGEGVFPADNPQVTVSFNNVLTREKTTTEILKK